MTTPVDRVAALARVLFETRQREEYPGEESRWDDWKDGQDGDTSRAQARVALAHARGLVPEVEELAQIISGCDPDKWPAFINHYDAWSESYRRTARRVRAETLRRLGGEGGP